MGLDCYFIIPGRREGGADPRGVPLYRASDAPGHYVQAHRLYHFDGARLAGLADRITGFPLNTPLRSNLNVRLMARLFEDARDAGVEPGPEVAMLAAMFSFFGRHGYDMIST